LEKMDNGGTYGCLKIIGMGKKGVRWTKRGERSRNSYHLTKKDGICEPWDH